MFILNYVIKEKMKQTNSDINIYTLINQPAKYLKNL